MSKTWIYLDVNYLCWRSFYSLGRHDLSFGAIKTSVVFGFLREVTLLQDRFGTDNLVFCFDLGLPKRREIYEGYKAKRHSHISSDPEKQKAREHMHEQVKLLRKEYLPKIGYPNILAQKGYEADDLIASCVLAQSDQDEGIIVSGDHDLYQLLRPTVMIHHPVSRKTITLASFRKQFNIRARHWAVVKSLTGCTSDEIPGIQGIGEKTAIKYLNGELKGTAAAYRAIASEAGQEIAARNFKLVKLPLAGVDQFVLEAGADLSKHGWKEVCEKLGLKSLEGWSPQSGRARRRASGFGLIPDGT